MTRNPRRRMLLVLGAACVLLALTAGVAIGAARRGSGDGVIVDKAPFRLTTANGWPAPGLPTFSLPGTGDGAISVPGTKCPRSHPKKIGSSSAWSSTQVDGGPVRRRARQRSICSR